MINLFIRYNKMHQQNYNNQVVYQYYCNKKWIKAQRFWLPKSTRKSKINRKAQRIVINKRFKKEILINLCKTYKNK